MLVRPERVSVQYTRAVPICYSVPRSSTAEESNPCSGTPAPTALGFLSGRQQHRGGIDVSTDNGNNWTCLTCGYALHNSPIPDVEVDAANPALVYAGTYGRGFWTYDWGTSLPECQP